ncbi:hypothetical protein LZ554_004353 [Drepanopeziza brunnea f. sp. 'monogermtubi']|nr:hypothetical protein LZ554_004353 [Drepanopeziza brunnea f. sp. 'monogermtubi']
MPPKPKPAPTPTPTPARALTNFQKALADYKKTTTQTKTRVPDPDLNLIGQKEITTREAIRNGWEDDEEEEDEIGEATRKKKGSDGTTTPLLPIPSRLRPRHGQQGKGKEKEKGERSGNANATTTTRPKPIQTAPARYLTDVTTRLLLIRHALTHTLTHTHLFLHQICTKLHLWIPIYPLTLLLRLSSSLLTSLISLLTSLLAIIPYPLWVLLGTLLALAAVISIGGLLGAWIVVKAGMVVEGSRLLQVPLAMLGLVSGYQRGGWTAWVHREVCPVVWGGGRLPGTGISICPVATVGGVAGGEFIGGGGGGGGVAGGGAGGGGGGGGGGDNAGEHENHQQPIYDIDILFQSNQEWLSILHQSDTLTTTLTHLRDIAQRWKAAQGILFSLSYSQHQHQHQHQYQSSPNSPSRNQSRNHHTELLALLHALAAKQAAELLYMHALPHQLVLMLNKMRTILRTTAPQLSDPLNPNLNPNPHNNNNNDNYNDNKHLLKGKALREFIATYISQLDSALADLRDLIANTAGVIQMHKEGDVLIEKIRREAGGWRRNVELAFER